ELFRAQAERRPDALAVSSGDALLTYGELNVRVHTLAHYLQSIRVGPESPVAICMQRSAELIVAMLGVLKAGGAYVPLDPSYPEARLARMLESTQSPAVLTLRRHVALFGEP